MTEAYLIDHTGIGVADVARAAAFYDAALGALGLRRVMQMPENSGADGIGYGNDYPIFWIDRLPPTWTEAAHAFAARSRAEVAAFYVAAIGAGATDNGAPGLRPVAGGDPRGDYAALVRDPDGNNVEAVCREP